MADEEKDVVKTSLDASLESLADLEKSAPSDEDLEQILDNPETALRIATMLKAQNGEEDEEKEDEKEEDEEKDEEPETKSDDDLERFVDAVPVMKSFKKQLDAIVATVDGLAKAGAVHSQVLKSLVEAATEDLDLSKSTAETVSIFGKIAKPRKGAQHSNEVMTKAFDGENDAATVSPAQVRGALMKAFTDKKVNMTLVSKAELGGWAPEYCPPEILAELKNAGGE